MPRHRVQRETKPGFGPKVEVVPLAGSRLVTVGPESPAWTAFELPGDATKLRDSFVRLRPPPGITEEAVVRVQRLFRSIGARTRVEMPNVPIVVPQVGAEDRVDDSQATVREDVLQIVGEAHTSDRDALRALVEEIMAENNL